ncbi:MAG: hypothetical protein K6C95_02900 [Lachnospiraceae bacterium]|nr:hypothetical protein [Lachnospiraceae bacterium]
MHQYSKNVLRGIRKNWIQYTGAVLIIALAVTVFIGLYDYAQNLGENAFPYFREYDFADIFAVTEDVTEQELAELEKIPGVQSVFGRQSANVRLETGEDQFITLHLLAYAPDDPLNRIGISSEDGVIGSNEIYCSKAMQNKRQFENGEVLAVFCHGSRTELTYAGTAICPQYIYYVPGGDIQAPVDDLYAFAAVDRERLKQITGKNDEVNEIGIRLEPGADPGYVKMQVQNRLAAMGEVEDVCEQKDQDAYDTLSGEIDTYEMISYIIPILFLAGAAFMVYIILKKAIDSDRTIIGTLKAMGAADLEILKIYLTFSAVLGLAGSVIAMFAAYPIGNYLLVDSATYYSLPVVTYHFFPAPRIIGLIFGGGTGMLSAWLGVRDVVSIQPSESMRAAAPKTGKTVNLPDWMNKRLNSRQRIALKAIFRNPFRSVVIAFSVSFPIALISCSFSLMTYMNDSSDKMLQLQESGDYKLVLSDVQPFEMLRREILALDHVVDAEPAVSIDARLVYGNHSVACGLTAYEPRGGLLNAIDNRNRILMPSSDALFLDSLTAAKLGVREGDIVTVRDTRFSENDIRIPVGSVYDTYNETHGWLTMDTFCRVFDQDPVANVAFCSVEQDHGTDFLAMLKGAANIDYIVDNERTLKEYRVMNAPVIVIAYLVAAFAVLSGGVMIYSIVSMNLRERKTEFGTMMVLGMRRGEIMELILLEQMFALIAGVLMTAGLIPLVKTVFEAAMSDDGFLCDIVIKASDYLMALTACAFMALLSIMSGYRDVIRTNLADVLKERS